MSTVTKTKAKRQRRAARRKTAVECWLQRDAKIPALWWRCPKCRTEHSYERTKACECGFVRPQVKDLTRIDEQSGERPKTWSDHSWVCPDCGHPGNLVGADTCCQRCNWDGTTIFGEMFQEGLERRCGTHVDGRPTIPETQAEAAEKEAAADAVELIELQFSERAKCSARIRIQPNEDGTWSDQVESTTEWKRGRNPGRTEGFCVHYEPPPRSREEVLEKALDRLAEQFVGVLDRNLTQAGIRARQAAVVELANERERLLPMEERRVEDFELFEDWKARFFASLLPGLDALPEGAEERLLELFHDRKTVQQALIEFQEPKAPARKAAKAQRANPSASSLQPAASVRDVPLKLIDENPINARRDFSKVETIAASMQQHGQLQECLGRVKGERIELIAGNCRYRAAKVAKLPTLRVRIIDVDDLTALDLMGEENEKRGEWSAIEKAAWYQAELDARGMSHRELAQHLGASPADVANHVRLLKLPRKWQDRVISREITPTMARTLAPWAEKPAVLKEVEESLRHGELTSDEFARAVRRAVNETSRPLKTGERFRHRVRKKSGVVKGVWQDSHEWGNCRITKKVLEQHREALDVVKDETGAERCFNVDLWWTLQQECQAEYDKRQAGRGSKKKAPAERQEPTPAERAEKRKEQTRQLNKRIWQYKVGWYQARIDERLPQASDAQLLALIFYFHDRDNRPGVQGRAAWNAIHEAGIRRGRDVFAAAKAAAEKDPRTMQLVFLRECICDGNALDYRTPLQARDVPAIAEDLGVSLQDDWQCDRPFLELFTKEQLAGLIKEWKLKPPVNGIPPKGCRGCGQTPNASWPEKRKDLIDAILAAASKAKPPKALLKAKGN